MSIRASSDAGEMFMRAEQSGLKLAIVAPVIDVRALQLAPMSR